MMQPDAAGTPPLFGNPTGGERVLFVHAHPDDETIATGGTIAMLVSRGTPVTVLTCTRGERGEVVSQDLAHLVGDGAALAHHRESELAMAMDALGVTDHRYLGSADARIAQRAPRAYLDSGMRWGESGPIPATDIDDAAFTSAELGEVAADIATVVASMGATAVVSYNAYGGYGHPDHIHAHRAARHAAAVMKVPFFAVEPHDSTATSEIDVELGGMLARKVAALRAHRSQLTVTGGDMLMPGGQVEPITTVERYRRDDEGANHHVEWAHTSLRSKMLASVVAVGAGAVIGALATVSHQATVDLAGVSVPIGLIGGLFVVVAVLVGLRLIFRTRILSALTATGLLGMIGLLSLESPGGSVLVPASTLAYYWLYGPALIAFLVLAWPQIARRGRVRIEPVVKSKGPSSL